MLWEISGAEHPRGLKQDRVPVRLRGRPGPSSRWSPAEREGVREILVCALGLRHTWPRGRGFGQGRLIPWLLSASRPIFLSQPLTRERDGSVHLPSYGADTHSVAMGGKLRSVCTDYFIEFRQMI